MRILGVMGGFLRRISQILWLFLDDILLLSGTGILIWMNFRVHPFFGWYSLAAVLIGFGIWLAILHGRKNE